MKPMRRPDVIIFVMAYLVLVGLVGLSGGLIQFTIVLPAIAGLGTFFRPETVTIALLGTAALLLAAAAVILTIALWRGTAVGRAGTLILAAILAAISALAIPVLLLVGIAGVALYPPLITAALLLIASIAVLFALTRPAVQAYFE